MRVDQLSAPSTEKEPSSPVVTEEPEVPPVSVASGMPEVVKLPSTVRVSCVA